MQNSITSNNSRSFIIWSTQFILICVICKNLLLFSFIIANSEQYIWWYACTAQASIISSSPTTTRSPTTLWRLPLTWGRLSLMSLPGARSSHLTLSSSKWSKFSMTLHTYSIESKASSACYDLHLTADKQECNSTECRIPLSFMSQEHLVLEVSRIDLLGNSSSIFCALQVPQQENAECEYEAEGVTNYYQCNTVVSIEFHPLSSSYSSLGDSRVNLWTPRISLHDLSAASSLLHPAICLHIASHHWHLHCAGDEIFGKTQNQP